MLYLWAAIAIVWIFASFFLAAITECLMGWTDSGTLLVAIWLIPPEIFFLWKMTGHGAGSALEP